MASPGSSPLTRGAPGGKLRHNDRKGLIPAHAGSTDQPPLTKSHTRAHPRSRGEHVVTLGRAARIAGSSPLTRGALVVSLAEHHDRGLIPAHAGSTGGIVGRVLLSRAHPRSRGEHNSVSVRRRCFEGSSPLTRGAQCLVYHHVCSKGLIPAHAGSTRNPHLCPNCWWAHPRSRGEHLTACLLYTSPSPRD